MEHERILLIYEYLTRCATEPPGVTIRDIRNYIAENSELTDASQLTIRRDLDRLVMLGHDIQRTNGAHNTAYYHLVNGGFTFNEIRFIVDSVSINKFLSDADKRRLIHKFEGLCSEKDVRRLISRVSVTTRAPSSDLLMNLDVIHQTIAEKRKIDFEYGKYDVNGQTVFYSKPRDIIPVSVVYFSERFYLICMEVQTEKRRVYRIDRMRKITAGEVCRVKPKLKEPEGALLDIFDQEDFRTVTLRVRRYLLDEMLETFGRFASSQDDPDHPECVIVRARVGISQQFYRWILRYAEDMEIIAPESIRSAFVRKLRDIYAVYGIHPDGADG